MHIDTLKSRMLIALNGIGTAKYDPREAVGEFLKGKPADRESLIVICTKNVNMLLNFFANFFKKILVLTSGVMRRL